MSRDLALWGLAPARCQPGGDWWGEAGGASGQQNQVFHFTRVLIVAFVLLLPPLSLPHSPIRAPTRPTPPPLAVVASGLHSGLYAAAASPSLPGMRRGAPTCTGKGQR